MRSLHWSVFWGKRLACLVLGEFVAGLSGSPVGATALTNGRREVRLSLPRSYRRLPLPLLRRVVVGNSRLFQRKNRGDLSPRFSHSHRQGCFLLMSQLLVLDTMRCLRIRTKAAASILFIVLMVTLEPHHVAVTLEGQDVRGDTV